MFFTKDTSEAAVNEAIGKKILIQRTLLGWRQEDLGKKIGVSFQQVQKYERGINAVCPTKLKMLSKLFGCTVDYLINDSQEELEHSELLEKDTTRKLVHNFLAIKNKVMKEQLCRMAQTLANFS